MTYTCKKCGDKTEDTSYENYCLICEDFTMEKEELDLTKTKTSFGHEHPVNCPNGCDAMQVGHASDVNFGSISQDVFLIYCPECNYQDTIFTR
mgnify:CR=1 FL=1